MERSESEESRRGEASTEVQAPEATQVPVGAAIVEGATEQTADKTHRDGARKAGEGEATNTADGDEAKPSNTIHLRNIPDDIDKDELSVRLGRFGQVLSIVKEGDVFVAKFDRTNSAYDAKQKLDGSDIEGSTIVAEFGPQDADHYARHLKRTAPPAQKDFLDGPDAGAEKRAAQTSKTEPTERPTKRAKAEPGADRDAKDSAGVNFDLVMAADPVSRWSEKTKFEEQLEDFMKMQRRGMYNRYIVLGKLPPQLRTELAIWHMAAPVQRDILHVEMLTCFGKPVAHVALRSATAAATMHRITEQIHPNLTVAFAPPRKATSTLWLGNVDDFVPRKKLEALLGKFGKLVGGLRYLPQRTCAFVNYEDSYAAVAARNTLYGLEVQPHQYLNVDFVDELEQLRDGSWGMWGNMPGPWQQGRPWGAPPPWGPPAPWGPDGWWKGKGHGKGEDCRRETWGRDRVARERQERSRSPRRMQDSQERPRRRERERSDSEDGDVKKELAPKPKAKVKLYKMGELCCSIIANFVKGNSALEPLAPKLQIDQRTKIDHCRSHMDKAGVLAAVWHFSAAERKDCAAYDALCDYFVDKERVGLVQTPSYYVYIVPPTEKYLKALRLPTSNFVVGIQIPVKK